MINSNHTGTTRRPFSRNGPSSSRNHRGRMLFSPHQPSSYQQQQQQQQQQQHNNNNNNLRSNHGNNGNLSNNSGNNSGVPWYSKDNINVNNNNNMDPWNSLGDVQTSNNGSCSTSSKENHYINNSHLSHVNSHQHHHYQHYYHKNNYHHHHQPHSPSSQSASAVALSPLQISNPLHCSSPQFSSYTQQSPLSPLSNLSNRLNVQSTSINTVVTANKVNNLNISNGFTTSELHSTLRSESPNIVRNTTNTSQHVTMSPRFRQTNSQNQPTANMPQPQNTLPGQKLQQQHFPNSSFCSNTNISSNSSYAQ